MPPRARQTASAVAAGAEPVREIVHALTEAWLQILRDSEARQVQLEPILEWHSGENKLDRLPRPNGDAAQLQAHRRGASKVCSGLGSTLRR